MRERGEREGQRQRVRKRNAQAYRRGGREGEKVKERGHGEKTWVRETTLSFYSL